MNLSGETLRLKIRNKIYIPLTAKTRGKKLKVKDFSVVSNNCWGGTIYESYGMQKLSPTVGMFIMPEDYLKFVSNLNYYLGQTLEFVNPDNSKWHSVLGYKSNWKTYLIGRLDDIELHMLHYHDEEIARRKWNTRVKRVNQERLVVKFNDQNGATPDHILEFMQLPLKHKLCFIVSQDMKVNDDVILVSQPSKYIDGIKASREPFGKSRYIDLTSYINQLGVTDGKK